MVFSSIIFLFFFLPLTLICYYGTLKKLRNFTLLLFSLLFYCWGEGQFALLMVFSIIVNYFGVRLLNKSNAKLIKNTVLASLLFINLAPLFYFKYFNFFVENISKLGINISINHIHLPIGISFFTFQAISYIIDVYRKEVAPQESIINLGLYIALFPQLIAGPIIRYHDIARQLFFRTINIDKFASGVERFVYGLGKKVLIANPMGTIADSVFSLPPYQFSTSAAWIGILCYTMQIYYDFSGYSDMAIGLGRMFGFSFLENFNYPYIAKSAREFWRRWHISLSNWLRDYLYFPLGGNRLGTLRTHCNLLMVFLLCGLWHGASWNFVLWGAVHGFFLVIEHGKFGQWMAERPKVVQHMYLSIIVINTWVLFRVDSLPEALHYFKTLYGFEGMSQMYPYIAIKLDYEFFFTLGAAIILSFPLYPYLQKFASSGIKSTSNNIGVKVIFSTLKVLTISSILALSCMSLASGSYNPFIYFRF